MNKKKFINICILTFLAIVVCFKILTSIVLFPQQNKNITNTQKIDQLKFETVDLRELTNHDLDKLSENIVFLPEKTQVLNISNVNLTLGTVKVYNIGLDDCVIYIDKEEVRIAEGLSTTVKLNKDSTIMVDKGQALMQMKEEN